MKTITHLKPVDSGPDPDIVEALEQALMLAKAGKVRDVLIAWVDDENSIASTMIGHRMKLIGLIEMVKHKSLKTYYEKR